MKAQSRNLKDENDRRMNELERYEIIIAYFWSQPERHVNQRFLNDIHPNNCNYLSHITDAANDLLKALHASTEELDNIRKKVNDMASYLTYRG